MLASLIFATVVVSVRAEVLARYEIAREDGSTDLDPAFVRPGVTASAIVRAGGLKPNTDFARGVPFGAPNIAFCSVEWPLDAYGEERMEITFTPPAGQAIQFSSMTYAFGGFPKMTYRVATNLDNYASSIAGPFILPWAGYVREANDSLAALPIITGPITFRWYAFSDSSVPAENDLPHAGFFDEDAPFPIVFNGTIVPLPSPVTITSIVRLGNGHIRVQGSGAPGVTYEVQATANLRHPLQTITTVAANDAGLIEYTDSAAASFPARFYRFAQP